MAVKKKRSTGATRQAATRVRAATGRSESSRRWLERQLNDPYVARARAEGYRSRSAFKLIELDEKAHLLRRGARVVDLGAAPGGWSQVAAARVGVGEAKGGIVVALDISEMDAVPGVEVLLGDFLDDAAPGILKEALDGPADVVLSDMAAPATGHGPTDRLRVDMLCEVALDFAEEVLAPGGAFVAKAMRGASGGILMGRLRKLFSKVRYVKPPASRKESAEVYLVATGFRGERTD